MDERGSIQGHPLGPCRNPTPAPGLGSMPPVMGGAGNPGIGGSGNDVTGGHKTTPVGQKAVVPMDDWKVGNVGKG